MNRKSLLKALKEKPMKFSLNEIQQIMDDELHKEPEEMNTELIDLCADLIEKQLNHQKKQKHKWLTLKKALVCAAVIAVLTGVTIPVIANYNDTSNNNSILIEYENSCIVNLNNGEHDAIEYNSTEHNLIKQFEEKDFKNLTLPNALINENEPDYFIIDSDERITFARADFNYDDGIYCSAIILRAANEAIAEEISIQEYNKLLSNKKIVNKNGMDIFVTSNHTDCHLTYRDKNTIYLIHLQYCSFDKAIEIAKTI